MSHFDRSTPTLDEPTKPRNVGSRLAGFGDRLARAFTATDPVYMSESESRMETPFETDTEQPWERIAARFPIAPDGYDRAAVDQHLSELERELADLRSSPSQDTAVAAEISRIGEQTSTILMTAHEQAQEVTRRAKAQADHSIAQAASRSMAMTRQAEQRLRELDGETEAIWSERAQLIDDVRSVASALLALAEESKRRFPADESAKAPAPTTAPTHMPAIAAGQAPAIDSGQAPATDPGHPPATDSGQAPAIDSGQARTAASAQPPWLASTQGPAIDSAQAPSTAAAQAQARAIVGNEPDDEEPDLEES